MILARLVCLADNYSDFTLFMLLFPQNFPSNKKLPLFASTELRGQITGSFLTWSDHCKPHGSSKTFNSKTLYNAKNFWPNILAVQSSRKDQTEKKVNK